MSREFTDPPAASRPVCPSATGVIAVIIVCFLSLGCSTTPDYERPLPLGQAALQPVPQSAWPDLTLAARSITEQRDGLITAAQRSLAWFDNPSTQRHFPIAGVSHERARASVELFLQIVQESDPQTVEQRLRSEFHLFRSIGCDDSGTVLFTGYYSPVFRGSLTRFGRFQYPLYRKPADLVSDPATGEVRGRRLPSGQIEPYPARGQIERDPDALGLRGLELVWLSSPVDVYLIHVNGSARIDLIDQDNRPMYVGFAGTNGREYVSIGKELIADGRIPKRQMSLEAIRTFFRTHPELLDEYTHRNERFVFFDEYDSSVWPAGSLGFPVTPWHSLATDKSIFPRGCPLLVVTRIPTQNGHTRPFEQFMLDQDTGGAIRAPGRADIYMGQGEPARRLAGQQAHEGQLYYWIKK